MLEEVVDLFQDVVHREVKMVEKIDPVDEFSKQNPAAKKLVEYWEETYDIFARSLVKEIGNAIEEFTKEKPSKDQ